MRTKTARGARRRGSVLLHVMVTGVLLAIISATIMRMALFRYQMAGRGANGLQEKRDDQAALASVLAVWNNNNAVCSGAPAGWTVNIPTAAGTCGCKYTRNAVVGPPAVNSVTVTTSGGVPCQVNIGSTDLP